jgi:hypothetical protein
MHDGWDGGMPALTVDWVSGEGDIDLGERLANAAPGFRRDVLADWQDQIELLRNEAEAELYPERREQQVRDQRAQNSRRRQLCERLSGQSIVLAEPLVNGDVLLHLQSGHAVVLYARHEDVKIDVVEDAAHARRHATRDGTGDWYVREDMHEDRVS